MAHLSCGVQCTRMILFLWNFLFLIGAFVLLSFGIYVKLSKKVDIALPEHISIRIVGGSALDWVAVIMITVAISTILQYYYQLSDV